MAYLEEPARASDEAALSPSPSNAMHSGHGTPDDELAKKQLMTESHSSDVLPTTPPPPPPSSRPSPPAPTAVLGASLLNSARVDRHHGSYTGGRMVRKNREGKLKRRTLVTEKPNTNLARRGDIYEFEVSPVKNNYTLPEQVNQKPLRIMKKKKQATGQPGPDLPTSFDLRVRNVDEPDSNQELPAETPTSPPGIDPSGINATEASVSRTEAHANAPEDVAIEENLPNGKPRCTAVMYKFDKKAGSGYKQCLRSGTGRTNDGVRCWIHISKAPTVQCETMMVSDGVTAQCPRAATVEAAHGARCPGHAENEQPTQEVSPREKRRPASIREAEQPAKRSRKRGQGTPRSSPTVASHESHAAHAAPGNLPDDEGSNYQTEAEAEAEEDEGTTPPDAKTKPKVKRTASIKTVFEFLNIKKRTGRCKTKPAESLIHQCDKSREKFQDETTASDTIIKDAAEIQEKLKSFSSTVSKERQPRFKRDAYSYVFHSLAEYLQALHDWLLRTHGSVTESLEALRILTPLLQAILMFKDTIAEWNVTVPQHYKGRKPFKKVNTQLIAPLRQVEKAFSVRLNHLEEAEWCRNRDEKMRREMEEQIEAEEARIEAAEAMQERKKRWQNLHIVRMQCEPDIYRRRKLFHTKFEDLVERDANGVVFERLPLFKSRSAPPHSRISEIADETEWTEKEETAVLEGLQQYAGPCVFEKMFKMYCDPRSRHPRAGDLRNRSVAEIVSKAMWVRSAMLVLCQETGEPVEEWVKKVPVLP